MATKTKTSPPTLAIPDGCMPDKAEEVTDLLYGVWTGDPKILIEHHQLGAPRLKKARLARMLREAKDRLKEAEAEWARVYRTEPFDEAKVLEAARARIRAFNDVTALSYQPSTIVSPPKTPSSYTGFERYADVSVWAYAMLQAEMVPDEFVSAFEFVARLARQIDRQASEARELLADEGRGTSLQIKNARIAIAQSEAQKQRMVEMVGSAAVKEA